MEKELQEVVILILHLLIHLWRASIEIFDFVPLTNASYSGGIIITDWFSAENKNPESTRDLKNNC